MKNISVDIIEKKYVDKLYKGVYYISISKEISFHTIQALNTLKF